MVYKRYQDTLAWKTKAKDGFSSSLLLASPVQGCPGKGDWFVWAIVNSVQSPSRVRCRSTSMPVARTCLCLSLSQSRGRWARRSAVNNRNCLSLHSAGSWGSCPQGKVCSMLFMISSGTLPNGDCLLDEPAAVLAPRVISIFSFLETRMKRLCWRPIVQQLLRACLYYACRVLVPLPLPCPGLC